MKNLKILAIFLILALSFSVLVSCDALDEIMGNANGGTTDETPDDGQGDDNNDDSNKTPECEHLFENSKCVKCGEVCAEHVWFEGLCTICNYNCNHKESGYENSVCQNCGRTCLHIDSINLVDTCTECGTALEDLILVKQLVSNNGHYVVERDCTLAEYIEKCLGTTYEETTKNGYRWFALHSVTYFTELTPDTVLYDFDPSTQIIELYILDADPAECEHFWALNGGGYCCICKSECNHHFIEDGGCEYCGYSPTPVIPDVCIHVWNEGVCSACGAVCEHSFVPGNDYTCFICGMQAIVPPECNHEWVDGVCTLCEKVCEHDYGNDVNCHICGELLSGYYILVTYKENEYKVRYEITLGEFISEYLGTTYEETVATGAYWMTVDYNLEKVTLEKDSPFMNYGMVLELYLIGGAMPPSPECEHEWVDGYCGKCGNSCQHSYSDSVCTICGKVCENHYFSGGECIYCGLPCEHVWNSDYRCEKCDLPCFHEGIAEHGYCTVCGYECLHQWNLTQCESCGYVCIHTFDGPSCTKCGYTSGGIDNPLTIYFEDTVYTTPYSASFQELFYYYSDLSYRLGFSDYEESLQHGYWVVVTDSGDVRIDEYTSLCEFGHEMTLAFRKDFIEECHHPYWSDGHCTSCGIPCQHGAFLDGMCGICGMSCEHSWNNGQCMICFKECEHSFYDGICNVCGFHEKGSDDERVTISLSIQDGIGSDSFSDYTVSVPYSIALYNFFGADLRTEDGATIHVPYETNFLVRVNGRVIDHEEFHYTYITGGEHILIYRCYSFELETVVNGESSYVIYNTPTSVSGAELMYAAGLDPNTNCTIWINGAMFESYTSFADTIFPLVDEYCCFIRFECLDAHAGTVRLEIHEEGSYSGNYYEAIGELNIANFISAGDDFSDFLWTLEYPNGEMVDLETLEMTLFFDPSYTDGENGATVYKLHRKWNVFFVNLQIDNQPDEPLKFYKSDNLTVRDILSAFGFYSDYDNYNWMFNSYGGEYIDSLDSNVYYDLSIEAYDSIPYIELNVDGVSYKYNHNETLTLAQAIEIINSIHGTSLTFEGYIWYGYSDDHYRDVQITDHDFIVVESGYSRTVTAKSHNTVNVYFTTDLAPLTEDGMMEGTLFTKGGEWYTPEIPSFILEMTRGCITFTGEFEYRVYDTNSWEIIERRDINSIEELLALNLTEVTLYAKYEVNYETFCGTYIIGGEIIVITEDTITSYSNWNNYSGYERKYNIILDHSYIHYRAEDGSFDYPADFFYEDSRIDEDDFYIVVFNPNGWTDSYDSYESYLGVLENYQVDYITDVSGNMLVEVGTSGIYFVHVSEKPYYEY